jgi:pimeloyl-ACP methyl ester carboxylesterase
VTVLVAACSSDGDSSGSDRGSDGTTLTSTSTPASMSTPVDATAATPPVEPFSGSVEDFYVVPDPLPAGDPGDLIRVMSIDADEGQLGLRVMYHSTDAEGDDRAVTGVVYFPSDAPAEGSWPVVAWAHGTTGLAAHCAPSRTPGPPPSFGVEGVLVATDYIGLGPEGELHPYLSAAAEANAVIDGVAAAQSIPAARAGEDWVVAGVSQGGHASLMTNERAAERLPDANLVGAVALAPGAQLAETYGDDLQTRIITAMVLVGAAAEDPTIDIADYLAPEALEAAAVIEDGCVGEIASTMLPLASSPDFFDTDPRTTPLGEAWVESSDPGQVASPSPLLLVQGGRDVVVVPARTAALFERLCGVGQVVDMVDIPSADHDTVTPEAEEAVGAWIAARFAGDEPVDDC